MSDYQQQRTNVAVLVTTAELRDERWRDFPDSPEHYEVSNLGRVRSKPGIHWNRIDTRYTRRSLDVQPFKLNSIFCKQLLVVLYWQGLVVTRTLRWVVARTWVPNTDGPEASQACGPPDVRDCRASGLRWVVPTPLAERKRAELLARMAKLTRMSVVAIPVDLANLPARPKFKNNCMACSNCEPEPSLPQDSRCKLLGVKCEEVSGFCRDWNLNSLSQVPRFLPAENRVSIMEEIREIEEELANLWMTDS